FESTPIVTGRPNVVLALSLTARGGRFGCAATPTETFALAVPPWPSLIVYPNVSVPLNPSAGVYTIIVPAIAVTPCAGAVTAVTISGSPSGSLSLASTGIVADVPSVTDAVSFCAIGK